MCRSRSFAAASSRAVFWVRLPIQTIECYIRNAPPASSKTAPVTFGTHVGSCTSWNNKLDLTRPAPAHLREPIVYAPRVKTVTTTLTHAMAAARAKAANIGSAQWVQKEREQGGEFVEQELEEFGYSVRNEMEWLNEHMAEIFSTNAMCVISPTRLTRTFANTFQNFRRRLQDTW